MAGSVNRVFLIGHLGRDPEIKSFPSGDKIAQFSMATSESWRDKQSGERKEKTEWHQVKVQNEALVKIAEQYLRKGSKVYIEGKIETREYEKDGSKRYVTEIVVPRFRGDITLLDGKDDNGGGSRSSGSDRQSSSGESKQNISSGGPRQDIDDDIPF